MVRRGPSIGPPHAPPEAGCGQLMERKGPQPRRISRTNRWREFGICYTPSATCPRESVLSIQMRPDFSVVFEGYAGGAEHWRRRPEAQKWSLEADGGSARNECHVACSRFDNPIASTDSSEFRLDQAQTRGRSSCSSGGGMLPRQSYAERHSPAGMARRRIIAPCPSPDRPALPQARAPDRCCHRRRRRPC